MRGERIGKSNCRRSVFLLDAKQVALIGRSLTEAKAFGWRDFSRLFWELAFIVRSS